MSSNQNSTSYNKLTAALKEMQNNPSSNAVGKCYVFQGQEQYLLIRSLNTLRKLMCPDGLDSFNYKRIEGREFSVSALTEATEALPFFANRTLVEIHDYKLLAEQKTDKATAGESDIDRQQLVQLLSELPEHVCVVFIYSTIEYKPDGRYKINKEILKYVEVVEFCIQEEERLVKWIMNHFADAGKSISRSDARYMADITGSSMGKLNGEIEKVAAYAKEQMISRSDIDAVVDPVLDAVIYKLTDAIIKHEHKTAMKQLETMLQMREPAHILLFSISKKMRQLLAARIFTDKKQSRDSLMRVCGIDKEYPAKILMDTARSVSREYCKRAVLMCTQTAIELNNKQSGYNDDEARIIELVTKLTLTT